MLNLSRTSRLPLRLGPVDLGGLVGQVRQEFEPDLLGREVHWNIQELPLVMGDHDTLRQVMLNLLGNALKYTRTRDVTAIRVWVEERAGETAVFVEDNGVGFDARYADKLFGCFSDCTVTRILRAWEWTSRPCAGSCSGMRVRCSRPASLEKGGRSGSLHHGGGDDAAYTRASIHPACCGVTNAPTASSASGDPSPATIRAARITGIHASSSAVISRSAARTSSPSGVTFHATSSLNG
ncbi:hypothetical protein GCM10008955_31430 [Deinococcus malanensis]|uniref:histidine kinase n=1 Tax=Deinococcus malanensis TaxID=1706855 RepID=A0ABQ2EZT8_9DEIO|nr:ATP-binding protein [Deinococcus malanensis]GGK35253.1 hypothetical protein GCM10008955_31430 [Deinococcus malanensis]